MNLEEYARQSACQVCLLERDVQEEIETGYRSGIKPSIIIKWLMSRGIEVPDRGLRRHFEGNHFGKS